MISISMLLLLSAAALAQGPQHSPGQQAGAPTDPQIATAVGNRLFLDQEFRPESIRVQSSGGVVTLSGVVDNLRSKDRAVGIAETVRGVDSVVDRLTVEPAAQPDDQLKKAVFNALSLDLTTHGHPVQVAAKNGKVILHGTAHSWAEKDAAAWVAKGVQGVRAVDNEIRVKEVKNLPDQQVKDNILNRIQADPWLAGGPVNVSLHAGKAILSGTVASAAAKRRAYNDAWVQGVRKVDVHGIHVDYALASHMEKNQAVVRNDAQILSDIRQAFLADPRVSPYPPRVSFQNGVATLSGEVGSLVAKSAAVEDAAHTVGVAAVNDGLQVYPASKRPDGHVAEDVVRAIGFYSPSLKNQVRVSVHQGTVDLQGMVNSPYQKWQAWDAASRVDGVRDIHDEITVARASNAETDRELAQAVRSTIEWDAFVNPADHILVSTKDGVVTLSGDVSSQPDAFSAANDAYLAGAAKVNNDLQVNGKSVARLGTDYLPFG